MEQRYEIREAPADTPWPKLRYAIVDTWNDNRVVSTSPYSGEILRKLYSLRNRVGNRNVYGV